MESDTPTTAPTKTALDIAEETVRGDLKRLEEELSEKQRNYRYARQALADTRRLYEKTKSAAAHFDRLRNPRSRTKPVEATKA